MSKEQPLYVEESLQDNCFRDQAKWARLGFMSATSIVGMMNKVIWYIRQIGMWMDYRFLLQALALDDHSENKMVILKIL